MEGGADSISHHPGKLAQARQDGVYPVWGAGFGCTLFRREVMERLPFRKGDDVLAWCPDLPFAQDAWKAGWESIARFDVPVTHIEYGRAIHPFEPAPVYPDRYTHSMWKKLDIWTCSVCGTEAWGDEIGIWNHWSQAHTPALADAQFAGFGEEAGVGGIDAVDIGIAFAAFRI